MMKIIQQYIILTAVAIACFVTIVKIYKYEKKIYKYEKKIYKYEKKNYEINQQIKKKVSMRGDIFRIGEIKFYVPNYPMDDIQKYIVEAKDFYEINELKKVDKLLPNNPVILDIGANIGSHTLYWTLKSPKKAKHVYAFEVIDETYNILKRNIEINNLQNRVTAFDFGLSNVNSSAKVQQKSDSFQSCCAILERGEGIYKFKRLDDLDIKEKVDFVKIDVEGQEVSVIEGAKKFLTKNKPLIWVELWVEDTDKPWVKGIKGNRAKYNALMNELGYVKIMELGFEQNQAQVSNFIYQHKSKIAK